MLTQNQITKTDTLNETSNFYDQLNKFDHTQSRYKHRYKKEAKYLSFKKYTDQLFEQAKEEVNSYAHQIQLTFGVKSDLILSPSRERYVVTARMAIIKIMYDRYNSKSMVGKLFDRDHTTIIKALENFDLYYSDLVPVASVKNMTYYQYKYGTHPMISIKDVYVMLMEYIESENNRDEEQGVLFI